MSIQKLMTLRDDLSTFWSSRRRDNPACYLGVTARRAVREKRHVAISTGSRFSQPYALPGARLWPSQNTG